MGWLEPAVAELEAVARVPGAADRDRAGVLALAADIRLFIGDRQGACTQALQAQALAPEDDFTSCLAAHTLAEVDAGLLFADKVGTRLHAAVLHGTAAWIALQQGDIAAGEARMVDAAEEFKSSVSSRRPGS